jgi:hypothetical protein
MGLLPMDEAGELTPYCACAAAVGRRQRDCDEGGRGGALELIDRVRNSLAAAGKRGAHQGDCSTVVGGRRSGGDAGEGADHGSSMLIDGTEGKRGAHRGGA